MAPFIRVILWVLLVVAPGGVFLLPLLVGDAVAKRKRDAKAEPGKAPTAAAPVRANPGLPAPAGGE